MQTLDQLLAGQLAGATRVQLACGLKEVPKQVIELADTLEILDLSGNQLSSLPQSFSTLKKLKILFLSNNCFTELPAVLGQCHSLEMIGFKANAIRYVPKDALPPRLRWLILTDNQVEELPESIGYCTRMQKLMLAGNKLCSLPSSLANCKNLELLRISANQLQALPGWLLTMPRLSWLALAGNPFSMQAIQQSALPVISWHQLQILEQLGEGASGVISKAAWVKNDTEKSPTEVAVKVFKGQVTSDGLPEDEMAASIAAGTHSNLVEVLGRIGEHPEHKQGLIFKLIPPGYTNLGNAPSFETCTRDTFKEGTVFSLNVVLQVLTGVASATAHLHARGILHGDLYAHNILYNSQAHALFGDFGAASLYDTASSTASYLQKIEVRAFGCLIEDLLEHTRPNYGNKETVNALVALKNQCMQEQVQRRPSMQTIHQQLAAMPLSTQHA